MNRLLCLLRGHKPENIWIADGGFDALDWPTGYMVARCVRCDVLLSPKGGEFRVVWPVLPPEPPVTPKP